MLSFLRNQKVKKRIYLVLAIAVIASFGVSGLLISQDDKKSASAVGHLHGKKISLQDYLASYKAVDHQARIMYGQAFDQVRTYINFKGEAWDRLLLLSYAKKNSIRASDREVVQWIGQQSFLQTRGQFDDRLYKMFVTEYLKVDPRRFEEEIREMLTIGKIQEKLESKIQLNDTELKELYVQQQGDRDIEYVVYSTPEDTTAISDEQLKQIYPLYQNVLTEPEKVKILYLLVPNDKEAELKSAVTDNKSSISALVAAHGLEAVQSDYFTKNESIPGVGLVNEIMDKSFSLPVKGSSGWIRIPTGLCKIEVTDKIAAKVLSFEESKEQLTKIYTHQQQVQTSVQKLTELSKDLKASDFKKFASEQKLEIKSMKSLKADSYIAGIGPSDTIRKALATIKEGDITKPVAVPSGAALVKVIKNSEIDLEKFEAAKKEFSKKILREKSQAEMEKLLEGLRKELKPNLTLLKEIFPEEETTK